MTDIGDATWQPGTFTVRDDAAQRLRQRLRERLAGFIGRELTPATVEELKAIVAAELKQ